MPHAQDMYRSPGRLSARKLVLLQEVTTQVQDSYGESHGIIYESGDYKRMGRAFRWVARIRVPNMLEICQDGRMTCMSGTELIDAYHAILRQAISQYDAEISTLGYTTAVQGIIDTTAKVRIRYNEAD